MNYWVFNSHVGFFSQGAVVGDCWGLFGAGMGLTLAAMPFWPRGLDVLGVWRFDVGSWFGALSVWVTCMGYLFTDRPLSQPSAGR